MQVEMVIGSLQLKLSMPDNRRNGIAIVKWKVCLDIQR